MICVSCVINVIKITPDSYGGQFVLQGANKRGETQRQKPRIAATNCILCWVYMGAAPHPPLLLVVLCKQVLDKCAGSINPVRINYFGQYRVVLLNHPFAFVIEVRNLLSPDIQFFRRNG